MATISLLEHYTREHDQTAVFLGFLECSSLYRLSIMGALYRYYHLFSQNFTGRHDSRSAGPFPISNSSFIISVILKVSSLSEYKLYSFSIGLRVFITSSVCPRQVMISFLFIFCTLLIIFGLL